MLRTRNFSTKLSPLVTCFFFVWTFVLPHPAAAAQVVVPPQTPLQVATTSAINPAEVNVGDQVYLSVTAPVSVDGVVVIESGARVLARITQAKENGMIGIPAAIGLVLESAEAVDGTMVAISGSVVQEGKNKMAISIGLALVCCILFAIMKGGEAQIAPGTTIMANTTMKTTIDT